MPVETGVKCRREKGLGESQRRVRREGAQGRRSTSGDEQSVAELIHLDAAESRKDTWENLTFS